MRIVSTLLPQNEGTVDRVIRVMFGAMLLVLVFVGPRSTWGLVGLLPLATGLVGRCPAYRLFGLSTRGGAWLTAEPPLRPLNSQAKSSYEGPWRGVKNARAAYSPVPTTRKHNRTRQP